MRNSALASLFLIFLTATASMAQAQGADARLIQVTGEASVDVRPDIAEVSIGVETEGQDPLSTLDSTSSAIRRVIDFAKKSGVGEDDIETNSVNLAPKMTNRRNPDGSLTQVQTGYTASNTIRVRIRKIGNLGSFTRRALENGANRIERVSFKLGSADAIVAQARLDAVADAKRNAEALAGAAGARVGRIMRVTYPPRDEARRNPGIADLGVRKYAPRAGTVIPIEAGLITVTAEVDTVWALE